MSYLSVKDVAEQLSVDIKTIYRLIRKGDLPAAKIGNLYRLRQSDVDSYVERQFERTRLEIAKEEPDETVTAVSIRCESCFQLIKDESQLGGACADDDCQRPLCKNCIQNGRLHCRHHQPTTADKLAVARQAKADGEIAVLITAVDARRRELNFRDRFDRKVQGLTAVIHPITHQPITVKNWMAVHTTHQATETTATQLPVNIESRYTLSAAKGNSPLQIIGRALSDLSTHATDGFDTERLTAVNLLDLLLGYTQDDGGETAVVVGLASTTGWADDAIQLLQGDERGEAWAHQRIFPCLIDLETQQIYASRADPAIEPFLSLFTLPLLEEEITAVETHVRDALKQQSSLTATEVAAALNVTDRATLAAFQRLAATNTYFIEDVDDVGQVIASL